MLPSPLFAGNLKACIVILGKDLRNHGEQGYSPYSAFLCGRSVIFERKGIPGGVAADDSILLIYGVDHVGIAVVVRWPTQDHYKVYFSRKEAFRFLGNVEPVFQTFVKLSVELRQGGSKLAGHGYERSVPGARRM